METWRARADLYRAAGCKVEEPDWDQLLYPERQRSKERQAEAMRKLYVEKGLIRG